MNIDQYGSIKVNIDDDSMYDMFQRAHTSPEPILPGAGSAAVARARHHAGRRVDAASDPFGAELEKTVLRLQNLQNS